MKTSLRVLLGFAMAIVGSVTGVWLVKIGIIEPMHRGAKANLVLYAWIMLAIGMLVFLAYLKVQDTRTIELSGKRRSKHSWSLLVSGYFTFMWFCMSVLSAVTLGFSLLLFLTGALCLVSLSSLIQTHRKLNRKVKEASC